MRETIDDAVVTRKGQVVIPVRIRKKVGIKGGTRVIFEERNGEVVLHAATPEFYDRTFGILKGSGLVKALEESRRKEKEHEERKIEGR